jgi:tungstate transport system ATP-binding protein
VSAGEGLKEAQILPLLEGKNLQVTRGDRVLLHIPLLSVEDGEVLALMGPNGAGKTTLLQTLCYLLMPFQGDILFRGKKVDGEYPIFNYRRKVTMVFQEPLLFDTTVFGNVASGLRFRGIVSSEAEETVMENLNRFGISHLRDRSARTLSGGEAQRTSLARAFAVRPEILLLDEPFASLDQPTRESLLSDLERILRESKTTTLLTTHDRMEALRLSDRVAVMKEGLIVQTGSPDEVMNHPVDEFVASFVGMETVLKGTVKRCEAGTGTFLVSVAGREIEVAGNTPAGNQVLVCIRPENVTLARNMRQGATSARNLFHGTVREITSLGFYQKVELDCGFPLVSYVTKNSIDGMSLQKGAEVEASFKATAIHVVVR